MNNNYIRYAVYIIVTMAYYNILCETKRDIGQFVSLIEVIANKDKYHGKVIFIKGYFYAKDETCAIFLSKEHANNHLSKNAIWLDIFNSDIKPEIIIKANKNYVCVRGTYSTNDCGHLDSNSGGITNITMLRK